VREAEVSRGGGEYIGRDRQEGNVNTLLKVEKEKEGNVEEDGK
jgi:hypothetical protein